MKTIKKVPMQLVKVGFIPPYNDMEFGKFYYSDKFNISNHLCPCGCGTQTPLPIEDNEWSLSVMNSKITISPSILHLSGCRSHYIIVNGFANIV